MQGSDASHPLPNVKGPAGPPSCSKLKFWPTSCPAPPCLQPRSKAQFLHSRYLLVYSLHAAPLNKTTGLPARGRRAKRPLGGGEAHRPSPLVSCWGGRRVTL